MTDGPDLPRTQQTTAANDRGAHLDRVLEHPSPSALSVMMDNVRMQTPWTWLAGAGASVVVVVVAIVVVAVGLGGGSSGNEDAGEPTSTTSPQTTLNATESGEPTSGQPTPGPSSPEPEQPPALPSSASSTATPVTLPPTPMSEDATFDSGGLTASVLRVSAVAGKGDGVGEISGPAVEAKLRLVNGGGTVVQLDGVTVNAYYGTARTPAPPLTSEPRTSLFAGTLPAQAKATGAYVFSVPKDEQDQLRVEISYAATSPTVVFVGAVQ